METPRNSLLFNALNRGPARRIPADQRRSKHRRGLPDLRTLDPRLLRDIGLHPGDLDAAERAPTRGGAMRMLAERRRAHGTW